MCNEINSKSTHTNRKKKKETFERELLDKLMRQEEQFDYYRVNILPVYDQIELETYSEN